jgi:hypothetical protein
LMIDVYLLISFWKNHQFSAIFSVFYHLPLATPGQTI